MDTTYIMHKVGDVTLQREKSILLEHLEVLQHWGMSQRLVFITRWIIVKTIWEMTQQTVSTVLAQLMAVNLLF